MCVCDYIFTATRSIDETMQFPLIMTQHYLITNNVFRASEISTCVPRASLDISHWLFSSLTNGAELLAPHLRNDTRCPKKKERKNLGRWCQDQVLAPQISTVYKWETWALRACLLQFTCNSINWLIVIQPQINHKSSINQSTLKTS